MREDDLSVFVCALKYEMCALDVSSPPIISCKIVGSGMLNYILKFPLVGVGGDGKPRKLIYFHFYHSPSPATSFSRIFYIFNTSVFCNECVKNLSFLHLIGSKYSRAQIK